LKNYKSRAKRLEEISKLTGVYCPELHKSPAFKVKRLIVNDYEKYLKYYQPLIPNIDIVHNRINLEIMRGCTRGCRFCLAGYINRPKRNAAPKIIKEQLFEFVNKTGIRNVTLSSLSSSDYVYIEELLNDILPACNRKKIVLSAPSLRIDTLDKLISFNLNETKKSSLTIAPEAGSHKLRCKINKNLTDEDIEKSLKFAVDRGYQSIKLYFMIGLPEEEDSDILGIVDIAKNLLFYGARKIKKIKLALSVFVPKPHTALQWFALASEQEIKYKIQKICDLLKYRKIEITWHSYKTAVVEALISRGAEQINNVILNAYNNGAKFDDWKEYFNFDYWSAALNKENLEISKLTGKLEVLQKLPWDYVDIGVKKEYLIEEYSNYLKGILREDCSEICHNCSDTFNCVDVRPITDTHTTEKIEMAEKITAENKFYEEPVKQYYYRLRFVKSYKIKFISHLDLQKLLITGLSNLQLDFAYTQGYNKKIKIEFIDALALGIIAVDEIMAVTTHKKID
ncbi:MAG TPA: DUF2344 domain-containing protein, partial [bacterium]|nr:DUF2344 domain-containing protein [bacterium]